MYLLRRMVSLFSDFESLSKRLFCTKDFALSSSLSNLLNGFLPNFNSPFSYLSLESKDLPVLGLLNFLSVFS